MYKLLTHNALTSLNIKPLIKNMLTSLQSVKFSYLYTREGSYTCPSSIMLSKIVYFGNQEPHALIIEQNLLYTWWIPPFAPTTNSAQGTFQAQVS